MRYQSNTKDISQAGQSKQKLVSELFYKTYFLDRFSFHSSGSSESEVVDVVPVDLVIPTRSTVGD